jgi:hypothetical protein
MSIHYPGAGPTTSAESAAGPSTGPIVAKKVTSRERLNLAIIVSVDERTIWTGRTGGPIRNPDFHEGQMLIELASALEEAVENFKSMLQLHADPIGWVSSMGIFCEAQLHEALIDPPLVDASAIAVTGSAADLPDGPVLDENDRRDSDQGWHDSVAERIPLHDQEGY